MSNLVREINAGGLDVAAALTETIDLLGGSLTLSSGKALSTIWSLYGADEGMQTNLYRLICDEAQLFRSAPSGDLLKSALDIAATLCVAGKQSASPSELRDMMQLGWQTLKMIRSASNKITAEGQDPHARSRASENADATLLSMAELSIRTPECLSDPTNASRMKLVIALLESHPSPSVQAAAASNKAALWSLRPDPQSRVLCSATSAGSGVCGPSDPLQAPHLADRPTSCAPVWCILCWSLASATGRSRKSRVTTSRSDG